MTNTNTATFKSSDEAIAAFNSGKPVWVIYSKPRALITAIEKITDNLVRITVNGNTGLHCASHLLTETQRQRATDSNAVNRRFFNGLVRALGDK